MRVTVVETLRAVNESNLSTEQVWLAIEEILNLQDDDEYTTPDYIVNDNNTLALMKMSYFIPRDRLSDQDKQKIRDITKGAPIRVLIYPNSAEIDEEEIEELL